MLPCTANSLPGRWTGIQNKTRGKRQMKKGPELVPTNTAPKGALALPGSKLAVSPTTQAFKPVDSTNIAGIISSEFKIRLEQAWKTNALSSTIPSSPSYHPPSLLTHPRTIKPKPSTTDTERQYLRMQIKVESKNDNIANTLGGFKTKGAAETALVTADNHPKFSIQLKTEDKPWTKMECNDAKNSIQFQIPTRGSSNTGAVGRSPIHERALVLKNSDLVPRKPQYYIKGESVMIILDQNHISASEIDIDHLNWILRFVTSDGWNILFRGDWTRAADLLQHEFGIHLSPATLKMKWEYIEYWVAMESYLAPNIGGGGNRPSEAAKHAMNKIHQECYGSRLTRLQIQVAIDNQAGWLGVYREEALRWKQKHGDEIIAGKIKE